MKVSITLTALLSMASTIYGCDLYKFCHCYDSNGMPNDKATQKVCPGNIEKRTEFGVTFDECHHHKWRGLGYEVLGNCKFRESCQWAGATGTDSSCRAKVDDIFGTSRI
ncbi:uncharacterized protein CTRU02_202924 [Colletotrichum truncatum]|uniref:Uncharacterized protein n=1 Tax=Colletotrichum truncatum TaxID=5467 RepID=A0ACC3ZLY7_COLTU|nr:uncharacterized protein CTRU02_13019 [Colletotrichum truncatum]KAF6784003.1 hypothetical protein CTRU02_13019 [Colletotrichum truncatum]